MSSTRVVTGGQNDLFMYASIQIDTTMEGGAVQPQQEIQITDGRGVLYCNFCKMSMCQHIALIVEENRDAEWIWEEAFETLCDTEWVVPLMAQERNIYALVSLRENGDSTNALALYLEFPDLPPVGNRRLFLSLTSTGEGRGVWRNAIAVHFSQWINDQKFLKDLHCTFQGHAWQEEARWASDMKRGKKDKAFQTEQYWSVFSTGMCLGCQESLNKAFMMDLPY